MKVVVGLGNPGKLYQNNRHNVGHMFVDFCLSSLQRQGSGLKNEQIKLIKTDCFMNQSGLFVKKLSIKPENLYIAHDDLDIPLGKFHIQFGVGPQLHNGLESIEKYLKTEGFWRIRIGVDARTKEKWIDGESYVLSDFTGQEKKLLKDLVFPKIISLLK